MKINREIIQATYNISELTQEDFNYFIDALREAKNSILHNSMIRQRAVDKYEQERFDKFNLLLEKMSKQ